MTTVTLKMIDLYSGKEITREIDSTNAMVSGSDSWVLGNMASQRRQLESWISDRGNDQHSTELELIEWSFS